ncbi:hypothetical protein [Mycobacterium sp. NPDC050041]|uniref:hypothetical protein n=1 Tax=Mycobacterium sp. NPDC050041 TaxID=3364293 RepID=UPI003C2DCCF2
MVLTQDDDQARTIGRPAVQNPYLGLRNYTNNLMRHGFTEAGVDGSGSDALIDALVAHGSPETIYTQIDEHLSAGANRVGMDEREWVCRTAVLVPTAVVRPYRPTSREWECP